MPFVVSSGFLVFLLYYMLIPTVHNSDTIYTYDITLFDQVAPVLDVKLFIIRLWCAVVYVVGSLRL